ncbi:hypothetical protein SLEP1_g35397 [Rubroshorea leprosula]|uniref:Aspartate/glutamate/uridylate kinase domain-containing protein n=1 Tax=Rubroshorea leprosula TaxID=152421 RepID=A0AAV5KN48_9ROSI|nr:hypothetical protein SLEP1_g35397 [Rubroshorea leprosula]
MCVMKFGGSSVASAERIREVAAVILSFPNDRPVIVLSAMGNTMNKLLLVWKDVDSVLTCDPNINPHAEPVPYLTFGEAVELAYCGAKVLHPLSMRPARGVIFLSRLRILTTLLHQELLSQEIEI